MTDKHNTKYNALALITEQPYIHARWSIFTFPGQNEPHPGHGTLWVSSGTVGKRSDGADYQYLYYHLLLQVLQEEILSGCFISVFIAFFYLEDNKYLEQFARFLLLM